MPDTTTNARSLWSSRFAFIMVTAGAAVGLGNIWKFPYMAGNNGGGVFVLLYLFFILIIGIPAMIAELMIGRHGRQNTVTTMTNLAIAAKRTPLWQGVGWLGCMTLLLVLSFYSVVAGWSVAYLFFSLNATFVQASPETILSVWQQLLDSPGLMIGWHTLFMLLTMTVVAIGVNKGIEQATKWMMPGLFIVLILLVFYAGFAGDFKQAVIFLFSFKKIAVTTQAVVDALGQAFFSLATGAGAILIYGSYLSQKTNLVRTVLIISALDVLVALLSGLAMFPIVFQHNLTPQGGPGLMFHVLPIAFSQMPGSLWVGTLFFILILFAAWTSSISMGEPLVALMNERWKISRHRGAFYVGALAWTLGLASVFSFNIWQDVKIFNRYGIFQALTDIPTNFMLPLGALLFCLFAGWIMKTSAVKTEFGNATPRLFALWHFLIRFIAPAGILVVLLANFF